MIRVQKENTKAKPKIKRKKNYDQREKEHKLVIQTENLDIVDETCLDPSLKTKFGYRKQFATIPKPQKTPYDALLRKYKMYEEKVKEAIKEQKVFRIISAYDVPTVRVELYKR